MRNKQYFTDPPKSWMIFFWCLFALVVAVLVYSATGRNWNACGLFIIAIALFYGFYVNIYWNYPILHEEYLAIQNVIFCSRIFKYEDIEHVTITNTGRGNLFIIKLRNKRFSRHFIISCVNDNDLDKLSADLRLNGVDTIRKKNPLE